MGRNNNGGPVASANAERWDAAMREAEYFREQVDVSENFDRARRVPEPGERIAAPDGREWREVTTLPELRRAALRFGGRLYLAARGAMLEGFLLERRPPDARRRVFVLRRGRAVDAVAVWSGRAGRMMRCEPRNDMDGAPWLLPALRPLEARFGLVPLRGDKEEHAIWDRAFHAEAGPWGVELFVVDPPLAALALLPAEAMEAGTLQGLRDAFEPSLDAQNERVVAAVLQAVAKASGNTVPRQVRALLVLANGG